MTVEARLTRGRCFGRHSFGLIWAAFALQCVVNCGGRVLEVGEGASPDGSGGGGALDAASPGEPSQSAVADGGLDDSTIPGWDGGAASGSVSDAFVGQCQVAYCILDAAHPPDAAPCTSTDAMGVAAGGFSSPACNNVLGWAWNGSKCIAVVGCSCVGSGCGDLLPVQSACRAAYAHCSVGQ
jgi:hypothetical protein